MPDKVDVWQSIHYHLYGKSVTGDIIELIHPDISLLPACGAYIPTNMFNTIFVEPFSDRKVINCYVAMGPFFPTKHPSRAFFVWPRKLSSHEANRFQTSRTMKNFDMQHKFLELRFLANFRTCKSYYAKQRNLRHSSEHEPLLFRPPHLKSTSPHGRCMGTMRANVRPTSHMSGWMLS